MTPDARPQSSFEHRIEGRLAEIAGLLEAFEAWAAAAGVSARVIVQCRLMLDELLTNVATYGYADGDARGVELAAERLPEGLQLVLMDHAFAWDPLQAPEPDLESGLEERELGGLGVHFVRQLADEVEYERVEGKNRVRILKKVG